MTTIVASPQTFQSLPRVGWDGPSGNHQSGFPPMSNDDVSRMFMPQRKVVTRSSSSSSLASNSSASSSTTVTSANDSAYERNTNDPGPAKKKQRGGFWPVSKAESTSSVSNARANGAVQPAVPGGANTLVHKNNAQQQATDHVINGVNGVDNRPRQQVLLVLLPINGTFERKQISVPMHPDPPQKIGRQTNNKTTPKADNGYFDSKVLSRQHAEIWADAQGRVWIRDVKSSNGTFVNASRLSPENRESEPKELVAGDTLELGIDIVSEDQKTIVHHKVSAKVEFAGFPGKTSNAIDLLNFGELDPSQNMLNSPMSSPMVHSRSQPGRPMSRGSVASSIASGPVSQVQQRQANYWGAPLNIEQLVKQVSVEMRAARQQAQDLEQARSFLTQILPSDGGPPRIPPGRELMSPLKQSNGRPKPRDNPARAEHAARFAEPPAPPPSQPLPEKPDGKAASPGPQTMNSMLKRDSTARQALNGMTSSPTGGSQIIQLLESLDAARKQIESQGLKVKELEDTLKRERQAREAAEAKAKRMEQMLADKPVQSIEEAQKELSEPTLDLEQTETIREQGAETQLQQQINAMLTEMQSMKESLNQAHQRAETAEQEKTTLAGLIHKYRRERELEETEMFVGRKSVGPGEGEDDVEEIPRSAEDMEDSQGTVMSEKQPNGHIRTPTLPDLQNAVTSMLQQQQNGGTIQGQYAPYLPMMSVVLIGVGIMAYLNSWQKVDK